MPSRRQVVLGGSLSLLWLAQPQCAHASSSLAPHSPGCLLAEADNAQVFARVAQKDVIVHSEDGAFDRRLANVLATLSDLFGILPGFGYYDDSGSRNAFASREAGLGRSDGSVLMGINFLASLRELAEYPEVAIAGVCAHEFGHVLQFRRGLIAQLNEGQPTVKRSELQADYFAGYFVGSQRKIRPDYPAAVVAFAQYNYGDTDYGNPNHHGTPEERGAAVVAGFQAAAEQGLGIDDAVAASLQYVLAL